MGRPNETLYAAIDVGTTKVATLVAKAAQNGAVEVLAIGRAESEGMRKGAVVDPAELTGSVRRSVQEARAMLGAELPPVYVGITGGHLSCVNTAATVARGSGKQGSGEFTRADIDRVLSAALPQTHPRQRTVQVVPRSYQVDGLSDVHSPVGMSGEQLSAQAHVVIGDGAALDALTQVVRDAGARVQGLVIQHLASAEAVLSAEEREAGAVLVDIGGGTSDIAVYKDGAAWHTAAVPIAGCNFTNDLAIGLGLPLDVAEAAKIEYGSASLDDADPSDSIDMEVGPGDTRTVSLLTLDQLLRDRAAELARLVLVKMLGSGLYRVPPGGIVLTGGSSRLSGLAEVFAEYGKCEARVGTPMPALGLPAELEHGSFSTAVGLLLWAIHYRREGTVATGVAAAPPVTSRLAGWLKRLGQGSPTEATA